MRYFIELAYKGTPFCGWQRQPNGVSVQGLLEKALTTLLREPVGVTGCGRTDAGVHADYFVAHFDSRRNDLGNNPDFVYHLNSMLPPEIAINHIFEVPPDAHARFDATERTYSYHVAFRKNPFKSDVSYLYHRHLDIDLMNEAAAIMLDFADFTSFAKLHSNVKNNRCTIVAAEWMPMVSNEIVFVIRANRFLRGMVRAIVGTMIDIGIGRYRPEEIRRIISAKDRSAAGNAVPACGLHLTNIAYPPDYNLKDEKELLERSANFLAKILTNALK